MAVKSRINQRQAMKLEGYTGRAVPIGRVDEECVYEQCSTLDLLLFVATIVGVLFRLTVLRPSPQEALRQFHHPGEVGEDQLTCPLILAGPPACPAILAEVKKRYPTRFRYAIAALGNLRCQNAVSYLESVMHDEKEKDFVRADALEALWLIQEPPPEAFARSLEARPDFLGRTAKELLHGGWPWTQSPWDAVWCWHD